MKINYTAIILTVLALVGLTIYRLLTPEEYLMILSKTGQDGACYFAKSTDGLHWDLLNDKEPVNIFMNEKVSCTQIIKKRNYAYELYYLSGNSLMASQCDDLINWGNPQLIEMQDGSKPDFSEINKVKVLYEKDEPLNIFCLKNNQDKSELLLFRINDGKISEEPLKLIGSEQPIIDFQPSKLEDFYVLTNVYKDSISDSLNIEIYQSTSINKDWALAISMHLDSEEWSETVFLQKNNREFWLYGKQNGIISVKLNKESDQLQLNVLKEKSDLPEDYVLVSGLRMRKDVLRNFVKDLNGRK